LKKWLPYIGLCLALAACNRIHTGDELSAKDLDRLKKLHLLGEGEKVLLFYSEHKNSVAGNIVTDKRLGSYWLDRYDSTKNRINSAFYPDILQLDTVYSTTASFHISHLVVTRRDSSTFQVHADGKPEEIKMFFETAIGQWQNAR